MHGAAGTVGSGYRVPNYRALSAGDPKSIHVLTFDYRGFGLSPGVPSERGICLDANAVAKYSSKSIANHETHVVYITVQQNGHHEMIIYSQGWRSGGSIEKRSLWSRFDETYTHICLFLVHTYSVKLFSLIRCQNSAAALKFTG